MSALNQLTVESILAREAVRQRNERILELRLAGYRWADIAEASGLTVNACEKIVARLNGGVKPKILKKDRPVLK